jgi:hypothetical protein
VRDTWAPPRFAHMPLEQVPVRREPGIDAYVYSGTSGAVHGPSHTYLPRWSMFGWTPAPSSDRSCRRRTTDSCIRLTARSSSMARGPSDSRLVRSAGWSSAARRQGSADRRDKRIARHALRGRATECADRHARSVRWREGLRVMAVCPLVQTRLIPRCKHVGCCRSAFGVQ